MSEDDIKIILSGLIQEVKDKISGDAKVNCIFLVEIAGYLAQCSKEKYPLCQSENFYFLQESLKAASKENSFWSVKETIERVILPALSQEIAQDWKKELARYLEQELGQQKTQEKKEEKKLIF